jgi:uncharacterized repeat protein (TIGR03803 family)
MRAEEKCCRTISGREPLLEKTTRASASNVLLSCILLLATSVGLSAQTYKVLYNFGHKAGDPTNPMAAGIIAQSRGGHLFSTAGFGGANNLGAAYRMTATGGLTVLHSFDGSDGQNSASGLTLSTDGDYYGTTRQGGAFGYGTVYKMSQEGVVTTLYDFQGGADGAYPIAPPIESTAGEFYGTTEGQGPTYLGSVYKITKYGDFTVLHTFTGPDGAEPYAPLVQATDFFFYGVATNRGAYGSGTIYRVSASGDFQVLYNFDGVHGSLPVSGLIQASDGNFYGVTFEGGTSDYGVLFEMTSDYKIRVLHNFDDVTDGGFANGGLVQATDGNLYGTNDSKLFRFNKRGGFEILHSFTKSTGISPYDTLTQHTNGLLYGTTLQGGIGNNNNGVFYSLDVGLKPFVTYLPTYGRAGASVEILGQGFTADSKVYFNGTPATFNLVYPTYIRATVPDGATTGRITVTTANGTLISNKIFIVHPNLTTEEGSE